MMMNTIGFRQMQEELRSNLTLTFTNSMSFADMQAKLDQIPRYLNANLTIQFSDGTYTPADGATLFFSGFCGTGTLTIQGNAAESGLHTNQAVIFTLGLTHQAQCFSLYGCSCPVTIRNFRFNRSAAGAVYYYSIFPHTCLDLTVHGCCLNSQNNASYGIISYFSNFKAYNNYIGQHEVGIFTYVCSTSTLWNNAEIEFANRPYYSYATWYSSTMSYYGTIPYPGWQYSIVSYGRYWQ